MQRLLQRGLGAAEIAGTRARAAELQQRADARLVLRLRLQSEDSSNIGSASWYCPRLS